MSDEPEVYVITDADWGRGEEGFASLHHRLGHVNQYETAPPPVPVPAATPRTSPPDLSERRRRAR